MEASQTQVQITMSAASVKALLASGSSLYGFRAVGSSDQSGRPLIWCRVQDYSTTTTLSWLGDEEAYTSPSSIEPRATITVGFAAGVALGQTLQVKAGGVGEVVAGPAGLRSIRNTTEQPCTCGLAQALDGAAPTPYCAFPLHGLNLQTFTPESKVLLAFSTEACPLARWSKAWRHSARTVRGILTPSWRRSDPAS